MYGGDDGADVDDLGDEIAHVDTCCMILYLWAINSIMVYV
jgi:hypothetical protein